MNQTEGGFKKYKHLFLVEFVIRWGTLKDTYKLPAYVKRDTSVGVTKQSASCCWKDDDYSF